MLCSRGIRKIQRILIWPLKQRRFKQIFGILCSSAVVLLLFLANEAFHESRYSTKMSTYQYVTPSGALKELFPNLHEIPYKVIPFSEGFLYPLEANMTDIAERRMRNESIKFRVINDHPFRYIHNPKLLCSMKSSFSDIQLLILIKSSVRNYRLREAIRKTWGKEVKRKGRFKMAFLLGHLPSMQDIIDKEQYAYQDIIQEDFVDAYCNNTHKTIMAYNWATQYCSKARTVLFLDDDMFVNLDNLAKYVSEIDEKRNEDLFTGILSNKGGPVHDATSKWFVPWHDYPYDLYPVYLAGSVIFASMSVVRRFQAVFPYVRYLGIDDVYLGIVAYKLNISPTLTSNLDNDNWRNFQNLSILIANHGFRDPELLLQTYSNFTFQRY